MIKVSTTLFLLLVTPISTWAGPFQTSWWTHPIIACRKALASTEKDKNLAHLPPAAANNSLLSAHDVFLSRFTERVFGYGFMLNMMRGGEWDHRTVRLATYKKSSLTALPTDEWIQLDYSTAVSDHLVVTYNRTFFFGTAYVEQVTKAQVIPLRVLLDLIIEQAGDSIEMPDFEIATNEFGYQIKFSATETKMFLLIDELRARIRSPKSVPQKYKEPLRVSSAWFSKFFAFFGVSVSTTPVQRRPITSDQIFTE